MTGDIMPGLRLPIPRTRPSQHLRMRMCSRQKANGRCPLDRLSNLPLIDRPETSDFLVLDAAQCRHKVHHERDILPMN